MDPKQIYNTNIIIQNRDRKVSIDSLADRTFFSLNSFNTSGKVEISLKTAEKSSTGFTCIDMITGKLFDLSINTSVYIPKKVNINVKI